MTLKSYNKIDLLNTILISKGEDKLPLINF